MADSAGFVFPRPDPSEVRRLGRALVAAAENHARSQGVRSLYLLTTTAAGFFERLGYRPAERDQAPDGIRETREFGSLCPSSATFMVKRLADSG